MKHLLILFAVAATFVAQAHAKVRFEHRSDQRVNPLNQTVLSIPFTLEDDGNVAVVLTAQFSPTSLTTPGRMVGRIHLNSGIIGGFAGIEIGPAPIHVATAMARANDVVAGDHVVSASYTEWSAATTAITRMLLIYDDGGLPEFFLDDTLVTIEEFLFYLHDLINTEIEDRIAADDALQAYIDSIRTILEERIALLEAEVAALIDQIDGLGNVETVRTELIAYIDSATTLLDTRITILEQQLADLSVQVDANSSLILQVQTTLQANLDALQTLLEARIANLEAQLAALAAQGTANGDLIIEVRNELQLAITHLQQLFETRMTQLEMLVSTLQQNGEANADLIAQLQAALTQLTNNVSQFQADIEARFAALELTDTDLQAQLDALLAQVESLQSNLGARIALLEDQLANLPVASSGSGSPNVLPQLSAVENRLSVVESRLSTHDQRLNNVSHSNDDDNSPGIETYLIPAGIGLGTSVLVNALWPVPGAGDGEPEDESSDDDPKAMAEESPFTATTPTE